MSPDFLFFWYVRGDHISKVRRKSGSEHVAKVTTAIVKEPFGVTQSIFLSGGLKEILHLKKEISQDSLAIT